MSAIQSFVDRDYDLRLLLGWIMQGTLKAFDLRSNVVLADCVEREFSADEGVEMIPLGLYLIKGDNVALIGEVDTDKDATIDFGALKAEPLPQIHF
ncbi:hypothetical protein QFC21_002845 [Naganishia friedmannii]|uniref:Uncharacterized protein n=1 Tax=Naganishia friedmannii TaxID=89922 RepID=A0ACC2VSQ1_9TREE|nr:hypothetical protein QFC21_002845 [Naganishia friedmannii]